MTTDEVVQALAESVGKKVLVTSYGVNRDLGDPDLLFIVAVDGEGGEGFYFNILTAHDPKMTHWGQYYDVADVRPA